MMVDIKNSLRAGTLLQGNYSYRILSVLGQGSFGITYKAEIRVVGPLGELPGEKTKVAIKEYFLRECNSREKSGFIQESSDNSLVKRYREKFITEARNLSRMKKFPDVVSVVEDFSANNTHYYVMEYIEGCNLDEYIHIKGGLSEDEALGCIRQIGKALIYMHAHGMLHLDLKPKNVMRRNDGTLVLIDFGLSKQYEKNGEPESSTTVGLGTPGYAPVEQANGIVVGKDGKIPYTLDVYALGATLYKCLVAKTPPHSSELINMDFPETKLIEKGVSTRTISVIKKAMSPRVSDRHQDVESFLRLLDAEEKDVALEEKTILEEDKLKNESVQSRKDTVAYGKKSWKDYNSTIKILLGLAMIANFICFLLIITGSYRPFSIAFLVEIMPFILCFYGCIQLYKIKKQGGRNVLMATVLVIVYVLVYPSDRIVPCLSIMFIVPTSVILISSFGSKKNVQSFSLLQRSTVLEKNINRIIVSALIFSSFLIPRYYVKSLNVKYLSDWAIAFDKIESAKTYYYDAIDVADDYSNNTGLFYKDQDKAEYWYDVARKFRE